MTADVTLDPQWGPLANRIAELVDARLREAPRPPPQQYFDVDDAARYLGFTPKALRGYVELGKGPRVRRPNGTGRVIRFHRDDLDAWMPPELSRDNAEG